jgi:hypothetical protein
MVLFAENHGFWQKFFDPFSGSQKEKYFIHLCPTLQVLGGKGGYF